MKAETAFYYIAGLHSNVHLYSPLATTRLNGPLSFNLIATYKSCPLIKSQQYYIEGEYQIVLGASPQLKESTRLVAEIKHIVCALNVLLVAKI